MSELLARAVFWLMLTVPGKIILTGLSVWSSLTRIPTAYKPERKP